MSVKKAGKRRTERCAWCDSKTAWQVVGGFGVEKSACEAHKPNLITFDLERREQSRRASLAYSLRGPREPSLAEMDLGIY